MKRKLWCWLAAALIGLSAMGAGVFWFWRGKTDTGGADWIRVTAVLPHDDYGYWTKTREGIVAGGAEYGVDVKIVLPRMNYDIPQMTELIRQETAAKVDALIVQGIEDEKYLEALRKAQRQGILIVLIDTDVDGGFDHLYVGTDNYAAGKKMGEAVAEITGGEGTIAVLSGAENYPNLEERYDGMCSVLAVYPDLQVACVEYNQYDGLRVIEKYHAILKAYPEVDTLVCVEGTSGQALGPRLTRQNRKYEHIMVFDLSEETLQGLCSGAFEGVMKQQQDMMGQIAVREIRQYIESGGVWDRKILTDVDWITEESPEAAAYE